MSMESEPATSFAKTATVEDLISYLRSTFISADFQNVAKTLTHREQDMKQSLKQALIEAEKWRKDYLSAEEKSGDLLSEHLTLKEECNRLKTEGEAMKEKIVALTEENNVLVEIGKLRDERYSKLLNEIKDLNEKNKGLCTSKTRAEADAEYWKKMYNEVDVRISRLEDEALEFFCQNPVIEKILKEIGICTAVQKGGTDPCSVKVACGNGGNTGTELAGGAENFCKITDSSLAGGNQSQSREVIEIDSDDEEPVRDVSTSCKNVRPSDLKSDEEKMFLNIEVSDQIGMEKAEDSLLAPNKRKRADIMTCKNESSDDDNAPSGKKKLKSDKLPQTSPVESSCNNTPDVSPPSNDPGLGGNNADTEFNPTSKNPGFVRRCTEKSEAKLSSPIHLSDSSDISDSDDENDDNDYINACIASVQRQRAKPGWAFEADMLRAFETDNEVCLNAVCALHRQRNSKSAASSSRGFQVTDVIRGIRLAKFLIDGDELGKLKKSVFELQQFDPKGLDDCRKLAKRYSKQLFDIYQKKEDPFFLPP